MSLEWLQDKGFNVSWDYASMASEEMIYANTSAKIAQFDILKSIRSSLALAIQQKLDKNAAVKLVTQNLITAGLWDKTVIRDPKTGKLGFIKDRSPYRIETILRTNIQDAYMANKWAYFQEYRNEKGYLRYKTQNDDRVRPAHMALHDRVWHIDHKIWQKIYPVKAYNCRCYVDNMTYEEAQKAGVETSSKLPDGFVDEGFVSTTVGNRLGILDAYHKRASELSVRDANNFLLDLIATNEMYQYFSDFSSGRSIRTEGFVGFLNQSKERDTGAIKVRRGVLDKSELSDAQKEKLPLKILKSNKYYRDGSEIVVTVSFGLFNKFNIRIKDGWNIAIIPTSDDNESGLEPL